MLALDDFITIGTQMKIERPGKACAITPCDEAEGPWVVLGDGRFLRVDEPAAYAALRTQVKQVWDNGELVIGYGEFMENNKRLVPAGYTMDWWDDMLDNLATEKEVEMFLQHLGQPHSSWPTGCLTPIRRGRGPHAQFGYAAIGMNGSGNATLHGLPRLLSCLCASLPPLTTPGSRPHRDEYLRFLRLESGTIEPLEDRKVRRQAHPMPSDRQLRLSGAAAGWRSGMMDELEQKPAPMNRAPTPALK